LENHPALVLEMSERRPLWGNGAAVLHCCRQPAFLRDVARDAGLPAPALAQVPARAVGAASRAAPEEGPARLAGNTGARWLLKPLFAAGGARILVWSGDHTEVKRGSYYLQEHIEGVPAAALYVAAAGTAQLLGLTRQLVGEPWLHAPAFGYCGSVGPLPLPDYLGLTLLGLGRRLAAEGGLRGLFGVDGILRDGEFWPIEINPRYTASVEVLEYATGLRALHLHRLAFEDEQAALTVPVTAAEGVVGKAILYAREDLVFPKEGPWAAGLDGPRPVEEMPDFADIPAAGERIAAGRPVYTLLVRAGGVEECVAALRERAAESDCWIARRFV
jgi:predicted ATP-grasp superfamily ATP-dependent carboligase